MTSSGKSVYVVFNPTAGSAAESDKVREAISKSFVAPQWDCEVYETTGKKDEDIPALCRAAIKKGAKLVVSAGGDGTLVSVANGVVHSDVSLGILPLGTGNDLARILGIPLKLEDALKVLSGENDSIEIDGLKVGDKYYFSNVSVGITPNMMKDTDSKQKKRFGRLAYIWTMFKQSRIFQMRHYKLVIDDQPQNVNAVEIMISNSTLLESPLQLFGTVDTLQDEKLEIYWVKARAWRDYLQLAWELIRRPGKSASKMTHVEAKKTIRIEAIKHSQLVQADGEAIGNTPVEVKIEPQALRVIMPKPTPETEKPLLEKLTLQQHAG
ncbi:MAG: diacylglycerol kinase family lipid kinase [Anaerolineae bacterium]|nr:diacylglycerol kinase family lipid kinase [Anaerolineae bacterium]